MSSAPAGWYPSPENPAQNRYWDGAQWTEATPPPAYPSNASPTPPPFNPATANLSSAAPGVPILPPPSMPAAAPAISTKMSTQKKWLIGGSIAAGVILVSSVSSAIGAAGNRGEAAQAPAAIVQTEEPVVVTPTPTPTPAPTVVPTPTPVVEVVDAVAFKAQAGSHLDDMLKDLDDLIVTVNEDGFWRLLSNNGELAFNFGQLGALDVPANVATTWPESEVALETTLDALTEAIGTQDGPTILAAVEVVRAQVELSRGVVNTAQ